MNECHEQSWNSLQTRYLIFFSMLYVSTMVCNAILTNKLIALGKHNFVLGGAFISPLLFILTDIIAELFGYKISRQVIWFSFICQTLFALVCQLVIWSPHPVFWHEQNSYLYVLGSLIRIDVSSFLAFIFASFINIYLITQWKILVRGRFFWLRSIGSSTLAEAFYSAFSILLIEFKSIPFTSTLKIILIIYIIKICYSIIFAYPANVIVNYIKLNAKIDIFDYDTNFTPFKI